MFKATLRLREKQLAVATGLLAGDFAFKQAIGTRDAATIASNAVSLKERIGADTVWITDDEGKLYADTSRTLKRGKDVSGRPAVRAALDDGAGAFVELVGDDVYQFTAAAVRAPDVIGVLVAGFRVDKGLADELKRQTHSGVTFATAKAIVATTLPERRSLPLDRLASLGESPDPVILGEPGRQELVLAVPVDRDVKAYLQLSWDESIEPLRQLQRVLAMLAIAALALTLVIGYAIADSVTASMRELSAATGKLAEGDYGVRVQVRSRDEVGQLGDAFNSMVAGLQEKEKIRSVLRKAVSKEIADELLKRGEINLGGEERLVTVLFSDVRSFTTISEELDPPRLVAELNEYFGRMSKSIEERRGVIDKYIGDAIMALFGAPVTHPEDAANAQRAALSMRKALLALNADRAARKLSPWETGIGLNTGPAVAGTLGSENRWSYTVIGDAVNLASRLEGLTKHYGCPVLVSADTKDKAGPGFLHRPIDLVRVKGRHAPVEVFELMGEAGEPPVWLGTWEKAVAAYRAGELPDARQLFGELAAAKRGDLAVAEYLSRLSELPERAPSRWDPSYTALEK
ncbi:MAG: HAMP domain-containing protein [Elusimicrobia bacterium]|nr:HAMP domain-containing protein [Elusimicrobiota bacterium]